MGAPVTAPHDDSAQHATYFLTMLTRSNGSSLDWCDCRSMQGALRHPVVCRWEVPVPTDLIRSHSISYSMWRWRRTGSPHRGFREAALPMPQGRPPPVPQESGIAHMGRQRRGKRGSSPSDRSAITRLLRQARARRHPHDIPEAEVLLGYPRRGKLGLTQEETARLASVSRRWYGNLEAGKPGNYSTRFLDSVRRALDLSDLEWQTLLRLAQRLREEALDGQQEAEPNASTEEIPEALRAFVQRQTCVAYISDFRWDLLTYNEQAIRACPWMLHCSNVMEWVLTYPEARTQLIEWEHEWARPMVAQLRLHAEQWDTDTGMKNVIRRVCADPTAAALWRDPNLPAISHPDITRPRRLYLPRHGTRIFEADLLAMEPLGNPRLRLVALATREAAQ